MTIEAAYGTWRSPITAEQMAAKGIDYSFPRFFDNQLYWMEFRPGESARTLIVQRSDTGVQRTLTPGNLSVQTRAQEYGGCCYTVGGGYLFFVNAKDQRIYCQSLDHPENCRPLSADYQNQSQEYRFADLIYDPYRNRIISVAEVHFIDGREPLALVVTLSAKSGQMETLVKGADFYSNPRLSPNGEQLLWLEWNHPHMPWDQTQLFRADIDHQGYCHESTLLSKGDESIFQPEWSPDGKIYCVSDRNQWWNLYRYEAKGEAEETENTNEFAAVFVAESECGLPQWQFGMTTWGFIDTTRIIIAHCRGGEWTLSMVDSNAGEVMPMKTPDLEQYNHFSQLATNNTASSFAVMASGPNVKNHLLVAEEDQVRIVATSGSMGLTEKDISQPTEFRFPTTDGDDAFGYFYPPTNSSYSAPNAPSTSDRELPPLVVLCHGGPTASTTAAFNLKVQFWTSRGFAVIDVNYRGSTGYGREYRDKLKGQWGRYDIDDACAAARHVVQQKWADPDRLIIRGSSAGGYTVLGALCFTDLFSAGCSLYGIGNLSALASDTHKFESRYTDSLIAPLDDTHRQTKIYEERSPICHIEQFSCPTIFFQGLKDKVVPPEQAEKMVDALNQKNIPVAFVTYADEAHGFRQTQNVIHAFNAELAFYGEVFGFNTDSTVDNLEIRNLGGK